MLEKFDKALDKVNRVVLYVITLIGCSMLAITWCHIFFRYVLNNSLSWSEELLKILLVWFCMLSASIIAVRREHVSIVIFKSMFPKKMEHTLDLAMQFIMFLGSIIVCIIGARMMISAGARRTPAMKLPFIIPYASVFVSFALMALYELRNFLNDLLRPGAKPADTEDMSDPI